MGTPARALTKDSVSLRRERGILASPSPLGSLPLEVPERLKRAHIKRVKAGAWHPANIIPDTGKQEGRAGRSQGRPSA